MSCGWAEWRINPRRGEGAREGKVEEEEEGDDDDEEEEKVAEVEVKAADGGGVGGGVATAVWRHTTHRGRWQQDVCEVSLLPRRWQERGKPDVTYAASSGHCAAA